MGSLQSILSAELIAAGVIITCAAAGYWAVTNGMVDIPAVLTAPTAPDSVTTKKTNITKERGGAKKGKKKKGGVVNEATSQEDDILMPGAVRPATMTIAPELLEPTPTLPAAPTPPPGAAATKEKKRKAKKEASSTSVSATTQQPQPQQPTSAASGSSKQATLTSKSGSSSKAATAKSSAVDEESWTRVENRRNRSGRVVGDVSDTGITTSVTEEEEGGSVQSAKEEKTSLEKLMPKKRKTAVDDMLEKGSQPELARVKRIEPEQTLSAPAVRIQPSPTDKPADGFTWGDYEDVAEDDEAPWTESRSKKPRRNPSTTSGHASGGNSSAPESGPTKKQRQNAAKREAEKKSKQEAETARLAQLAKYKKEQEKAKIEEQYKHKGGKTLGGGMKASVDASGSLVWD